MRDRFNWTGNSYDNTEELSATTWRHVKFVEQAPVAGFGGNAGEQTSWTFSSDVCKRHDASLLLHWTFADALQVKSRSLPVEYQTWSFR